jgi:hypothetical protein
MDCLPEWNDTFEGDAPADLIASGKDLRQPHEGRSP